MMEDQQPLDTSESGPSKTLALLLSVTPHLLADNSSLSPAVRENIETLEGYPAPISYLTADQLDEYVNDADASLGSSHPSSSQSGSPHHEVALRNPHSVYNWLRRNEPKIFLQDGEGSEKSLGKPGSLRGAGKRASMPGPAKHDALEIVEEDGMRYDPTIGGLSPPATTTSTATATTTTKSGKRKREDDAGYHPKSGAPGDGKMKKPRPRKKKGGDGESAPPSAPSSTRKGKSKGRHSSDAAEVASNASNPA